MQKTILFAVALLIGGCTSPTPPKSEAEIRKEVIDSLNQVAEKKATKAREDSLRAIIFQKEQELKRKEGEINLNIDPTEVIIDLEYRYESLRQELKYEKEVLQDYIKQGIPESDAQLFREKIYKLEADLNKVGTEYYQMTGETLKGFTPPKVDF